MEELFFRFTREPQQTHRKITSNFSTLLEVIIIKNSKPLRFLIDTGANKIIQHAKELPSQKFHLLKFNNYFDGLIGYETIVYRHTKTQHLTG